MALFCVMKYCCSYFSAQQGVNNVVCLRDDYIVSLFDLLEGQSKVAVALQPSTESSSLSASERVSPHFFLSTTAAVYCLLYLVQINNLQHRAKNTHNTAVVVVVLKSRARIATDPTDPTKL